MRKQQQQRSNNEKQEINQKTSQRLGTSVALTGHSKEEWGDGVKQEKRDEVRLLFQISTTPDFNSTKPNVNVEVRWPHG